MQLSDDPAIQSRATLLCDQYDNAACRRTDRQFAVLMMLQWLAGIAIANWNSPGSWVGTVEQPHPHMFAAVFLGAATNLGPALMAALNPGAVLTRHVIAVGQSMTSALLIYLTDGRIETHFHVFGSLAFLAFYREWRVLVLASAIVASNHLLRGFHIPESVYGTANVTIWRTIEHAGWVAFEDVFLMLSIVNSREATQHAAEQQAQAEAANHAKSAFLAAMSHDLRTPLNGILGMNDLLVGTDLTDKQRQFVDASRTSGKLLLQLINNVLDLSKMESGKLELDLQVCSIETLVYDVAEALCPGAAQKGLSVKVDVDLAVSVKAMCDGNRLRQILVNLIGNAIKFTETGTITVSVTCARDDVWVPRVRFAVTDSGIGIPEDCRDRLFTPFTQVDSSTTRKFGGSGLGLAICKQLVERMDGSIGIESQIGVGSTFWFELPLQVVHQNEDSTGSWRRPTNARVLIVEDEAHQRVQLSDCLTIWRCLPTRAFTDEDALQAVAQATTKGTPFDIALVDLQTATGNRYRLIDDLSRRHGLPVIAIGSTADNGDADWLSQRGIRRMLRDPVRSSTLCDALLSTLAVTAVSLKSSETDQRHEIASSLLTGHVLVAEDNHINQMYVTELLKHCGCTCDVVANGELALEAMQRERYDLVLMDCQMPEMDGFTAAGEIRRRDTARQLSHSIPIIALTANALKGDREHCLEAGMDDYLTKPIEAPQLRAMLEQYLPSNAS